ncbi:MAG: hypothetical protein KDE09_04335 [Anaerolineales bacterium]|nr:hypothetical protein [Anaerolineales bacterium]MCB8959525.1 hypothetical protein [Ardenticatenales bacterium]MCB0006970.1 hypothetical protein [Anaerolineales bacterium]MCB0010628.1 hypothetical protein [Anaerolineales bacterium]MCB0016994.1 hypothetical protein [Anaerolineales bacterium]
MSSRARKTIDGIKFHGNKPTELPLKELYTWVVWQFPRFHGDKLCGAVHPPIKAHGWLPAVILSRQGRIEVYAHLEEAFATPEEAADALNGQVE